MDTSFFFRVEHDLLRSQAFQQLGGSAIKVYLILGLYSDFGTGWAYPSIRTIARQAGLSRQTVLDAIAELARAGLVATSKAKGRSTAYRIIRQAPHRPGGGKSGGGRSKRPRGGPETLEAGPGGGPFSLEEQGATGPETFEALAQLSGPIGRVVGPKPDPGTREESTSIPIPGTPFRLTADGRLLVAVDLQELLTNQGLPPRLAERLAAQKAPEDVAKVLLNALYLQSQGKLQNRSGYIRAGLEDGYELLPQVASRLESRRRELLQRIDQLRQQRAQRQRAAEQAAEEAAVALLIEQLHPEKLRRLVEEAVAALPAPLVRRNPTLSNPFVRAKVYELAGGAPSSDSAGGC
jgi:hypothetical protein